MSRTRGEEQRELQDEALLHYAAGLSYAAIARRVNADHGTDYTRGAAVAWVRKAKARATGDVTGVVTGARSAQRRSSHTGGGESSADSIKVREYVFSALTPDDDQPPLIPVFTGEPHMSGDVIVVGDVHLPTTDFALAAQVVDVARRLNIRQLAIVGDLVNFDVFSTFDHIVPPIPAEVEIRLSVRLMDLWARWFSLMVMVLGNHDHRLLRVTEGQISATTLGRILSACGSKLQVSPYSQIVIESGGQVWRCTHQQNYSKIKGRVGDALAQKYQCNVVTLHQHHVGKIMDSYGRYCVIDGGGLFDDQKMAYVKLRDSLSPCMTRGFVVIRNGVGHLVTPYAAYTDQALWGLDSVIATR